jgi:ABC-type phosphate/phosphonate transport system ATPase subunit
METITIPKQEYIEMQSKINELTKKLALLQDQEFLSKLELAYRFFIHAKKTSPTNHQPVSIKRGSAKQIITYIADDFTAPLPDFRDYL